MSISRLKAIRLGLVESAVMETAGILLCALLGTSNVSVTVSYLIKMNVSLTLVASKTFVSRSVMSFKVMLMMTVIMPSPISGTLRTVPPVRVTEGPVGGLLCIVSPEKLKNSGKTGLLKVSKS